MPLNNYGDEIVLFDDENEIDRVKYSSSQISQGELIEDFQKFRGKS